MSPPRAPAARLRASSSTARPDWRSDAEEPVAEVVGEARVAARRAPVDAAGGGEHEAGRVELQHDGYVVDRPWLEGDALRCHVRPGFAAVAARHPHPDLE